MERYSKSHSYRRLVDAAPNHYALDRIIFRNGDAKWGIEKLAVISWEIKQSGNSTTVYPITYPALSSLFQGEVLYPDGKVRSEHYGLETYDDFLCRVDSEMFSYFDNGAPPMFPHGVENDR